MSKSRIHIPSEQSYADAAELLRGGDLVSFPTETVYGLGADATNEAAVAKIFTAKKRPSFNPLIVHIANTSKAAIYVKMNHTAKRLAEAFWPGPFTMVLPIVENCGLSDLIAAGLSTVAIRVPQNVVAHELLCQFDGPVAAPSANKSGRISPTTAAHVDGEFGDELKMIIDGGACEKGIESTIVQIMEDDVILLRPGTITAEDIENITGYKVTMGSAKQGTPNAPGQLFSHYAPQCKMRLDVKEPADGECLLAYGDVKAHPGLNLSPSGDLSEAAANLFSMMRQLDKMNYSTIAVSPIPKTGLGIAINDRLKRAAAPRNSS